MASRRIRAVIVEDHAATVAGVRIWCERADPPMTLIDAQANFANVWNEPGASADVVILDLELTAGNPVFGELKLLVESDRRVVVYSQRCDNETAIKCIDFGALAYLTKREGEEHLVPAIRAAAEGQSYTGPSLSGALATDLRPARPRISPRELAVLRAWFACASKELVAVRLQITVKTVETYIDRVRVKYANVGRPARTKSDLVTRALEDGLVSLTDLSGTGDGRPDS